MTPLHRHQTSLILSLMGSLRLSLLDSYLLRQLIPPFILSVALFSSLGVAVASISDLSYKVNNFGLPIGDAIKIFFLKIPEYVSYSLPISVLLTTLITYGRLSKDWELIAFYNCGLSLFRLLLPALVFSFFVTGITFFLNESVVPSTNFRASSILVDTINEERKFLWKRDIFFPEYKEIKVENNKVIKYLKTLFYAQKFEKGEMRYITILETENRQLSRVIVSERGVWNAKENAWDLFNGFVYEVAKNVINYEGEFFEKMQIYLPKTPLELAMKSRDPYEMNIAQSLEYIKILKILGDDKNVLIFQVRTAQKVSFPFVCVVFAVVGVSLGCRSNNASKATSFGLCVAMVFAYYLSSFLIGSLGIVGIITPVMAAWIPNFVGLIVGGYLLFQNNRNYA
ncbi:MAG: LptF/LptG family permease [Geminocystis sp.]|nr:LptF/LptG family permease [Geminocystis sp.]